MRAGGNKNSGFTIVETLIVIAVSGFLVMSALVLISGRQNKTEFQVAINNLQQQFQQIINETASGFYPNTGNTFKCQGNTGPAGVPDITSGSGGQGSNQGCIFLGKVIRLGAGAGSSSDKGTITVYPLVGNQQDTSVTPHKEVTDYVMAKPILLAPGLHTQTAVPDDSTIITLNGGLTYVDACYSYGAAPPACGNTITAVAFVASLNSYNVNGTLNSGSQQLNLWGFNASASYPWSSAMAGGSFVDSVDDAKLLPVASNISKAAFCFASGTTNQSGLITIGGSGSLAVSLKIFGNTTCT